jgi:hypothetical protein
MSELKIASIRGHTDRQIFAINHDIGMAKTQACSDTLPATVPASVEGGRRSLSLYICALDN